MKYAVCNEIFTGCGWEEICRFARQTGFDGIEIAPLTFAESVTDVTAAKRKEILRTAKDHGLEVAALHMLMFSPKGLHINSPCAATRQKAADYLRALMDFAADLECKLMVYGSPPSRNVHPDLTYQQARDYMKQAILGCMDRAAQAGITLCIEPLPADATHLFATVEAAYNFVAEVKHPNLGLMVDCKAMSNDKRPVADTIKLFGPYIRHVHGNDAIGKAPGFGTLDFAPILEALRTIKFDGYFSLEPFDYKPDAQTVVPVSLKYLKSL